MEPRNIDSFDVNNKKERFAIQQMKQFIESKDESYGKILVLYGLRRTGKTTMMEQTSKFYNSFKNCAFYEISNDDSINDIKNILIQEKNKGTEIICFDEITKAKDFITNSAVLPDIFAKENMKIIVAGTDSLGFVLAERTELFDRTVRVNTTHISYAEHSKVLNVNDIDDYIMYGGLMHKGLSDLQVSDYDSAKRYLNSAVAENIAYSIKSEPHDNQLKQLSFNEVRTIIEKLVELYSGSFNKEVMQKEIEKVSINEPVKGLYESEDFKDALEPILLNSKDITKDFTSIINADSLIRTEITEDMVKCFEQYLAEMDLLSSINKKDFRYTDAFGWTELPNDKEIYIIQPAIKYFHLEKGKEFIENEVYYNQLTGNQKEKFKEKLDEYIKGEMVEQIVVFDTSKDLPSSRYYVCKPVFTVNGKKAGEYDMLVYDKQDNKHWLFEIKHTKNPCIEQEKHFSNESFRAVIEEKYGTCVAKCVLYRGENFISNTDAQYINISDFLISINTNKNMDFALKDIKMLQEEKKLPEFKNDINHNIVDKNEEVKSTRQKRTKKRDDDIGYGY